MHSFLQIAVQLVGSLLILAAFALAQFGVLDPKSRVYLVLNVVGSAVLAVDALLGAQWGFLLLEGVWAVVSAMALGRVLVGRRGARSTTAVAGAAAATTNPSGRTR